MKKGKSRRMKGFEFLMELLIGKVDRFTKKVEGLAKKLDDELKIVITPTEDGAVLSYKPGYKPENIRRTFKFSADDNNLEGAVDLLYCLRDILADPRNRYAKQRIDIRIVHGDKYECKDKNCEICKENKED